MASSPVSDAAEQVDSGIAKIPLPTIETYEPEALVAAAAAYAAAARKVQDAEKEVARLQLEQLDRDKRIAQLEEALADLPGPAMDVWACTRYMNADVGNTGPAAVIPGYWNEEATPNYAVLFGGTDKERTVATNERLINLIPSGIADTGTLVPSEAMTDAAVFYNAAMEPGHLKWKPIWRYGVLLTDGDGDVCSLRLEKETARGWDELPIDTDDDEILVNVPISYPPCNGAVFEEDDAVLVLFEGHERDQPKVIGFRRKPKLCPGTWIQLR